MSSQKVFAIGDIHGCLKELKELVTMLPLEEDSIIVFLGDYVDRGPDSKGVIDYIIQLKEKYNVITLMGNHEQMMLQFFKDPSSAMAAYFIFNGGSATLASYVVKENEYSIPPEHIAFLEELQLSFETDRHFFVHAGVPNVKLSDLDAKTDINEMLWIRNKFLNSTFKWSKTIVHGHTPVEVVQSNDRRINLDTGCVFSGYLSAMEVNSGEIFQVKAGLSPRVFLKANPQVSRVAARFAGQIPVYVESDEGYETFQTLNFNEFGMLILQLSGAKRAFEVGQILAGKIGDLTENQINFKGQVVRHQMKEGQIAFGIKMIEPLSSTTKF